MGLKRRLQLAAVPRCCLRAAASSAALKASATALKFPQRGRDKSFPAAVSKMFGSLNLPSLGWVERGRLPGVDSKLLRKWVCLMVLQV